MRGEGETGQEKEGKTRGTDRKWMGKGRIGKERKGKGERKGRGVRGRGSDHLCSL